MGAVAPPIDVATGWRCSGGRGTGDVGRVLFNGKTTAAIGGEQKLVGSSCADAAGALQVVMQPWIGEQAARLGKAAATASP
jgi:hypothetical protein